MLQLRFLPWPPSDNRKYLSRRFIKTPEWRSFEADIEAYIWNHLKEVKEARIAIKRYKRPQVEFLLYSPRWETKAGHTRRLDASNRSKSIQDAVAKILEIDDSLFWKSSSTKVLDTKEHCTALISEFSALQTI